MRVLVADDQNELRLLVASQLQQAGHSVVDVADGKAALAEINRAPFDVILLDEHMPGLSGVDVLHAIRANERTTRQAVIALTGYNSEPDRLRLLHEGFDFVIGKPFSLSQVESTLLSVLRGGHVSEPTPPPTPSHDLLQTVGGDRKLLLRMIRTFLRDLPKRLAQIETAIQRGNAAKLESSAHALKGTVAIFGSICAREYCQELQDIGRGRELSGAGVTLKALKEEIAKLEANLANLRGYAGQTSLAAPRKRKRPDSAAKRKPR